MSSVLYDVPGPAARRRSRIGSVVGGLIVLALLVVAVRYASGRGIFEADRWDVLYAPPKNQTAADVWRSMIVVGLGATLKAAALAAHRSRSSSGSCSRCGAPRGCAGCGCPRSSSSSCSAACRCCS